MVRFPTLEDRAMEFPTVEDSALDLLVAKDRVSEIPEFELLVFDTCAVWLSNLGD